VAQPSVTRVCPACEREHTTIKGRAAYRFMVARMEPRFSAFAADGYIEDRRGRQERGVCELTSRKRVVDLVVCAECFTRAMRAMGLFRGKS
jgi:hypothetical protein